MCKMKARHIVAALLTTMLMACADDDGDSALCLVSAQAVSYDASCQMDTVRLTASGHWTVETDAEWVTLCIKEGTSDGLIPIYIQQNDMGRLRSATLTISASDGHTQTVSLSQMPTDGNGAAVVNMPLTFGIGWGYDLAADVADAQGLRGQVFDAAALVNDYGTDAFHNEPLTSTSLKYVREESTEQLQTKMAAKFAGRADILVASAKVSVEFARQISEQRDRLYVWCRDLRTVKKRVMDNDIELTDKEVALYCTTADFRQSVYNDTPADFVRKYGTHIVTSTTLGGKLDYWFTVSKSVSSTVEQIITEINVRVLFIKKSWTTVSEDSWEEVQKDFIGNFHVAGGGTAGVALDNAFKVYAENRELQSDTGLYETWYKCFESSTTARDEDLVMVDCGLTPIWNVVGALDKQKAADIENYVVKQYLKK